MRTIAAVGRRTVAHGVRNARPFLGRGGCVKWEASGAKRLWHRLVDLAGVAEPTYIASEAKTPTRSPGQDDEQRGVEERPFSERSTLPEKSRLASFLHPPNLGRVEKKQAG